MEKHLISFKVGLIKYLAFKQLLKKLVNMNESWQYFLGKKIDSFVYLLWKPFAGICHKYSKNWRYEAKYAMIASKIMSYFFHKFCYYDNKVDLDILTNTAWLESKAKIWRDSQSNTWKRRPAQQSWVCLHTRKGARSFVSPWSEDMVWYVSVRRYSKPFLSPIRKFAKRYPLPFSPA